MASRRPVVALPHPDDESFLVAAAHAFALMQDDFGAVLVLHPAGSAARRVRAARNLADSKHVLPLSLTLPDTAVAAVADLVAQLSGCDVPAGAIVGSVGSLLEAVTVVARTSSVTRLSAVDVGLRSHLTSILPGTSFFVGLSPAPFLRRRPTTQAPARHAEGPQRLATAGDAAYGASVMELLESAGDTGSAGLVHRPGPEPVTWWQSRHVFEATRMPADISALATALRDRPSPRCDSCGDIAVESECRFCSAMEVL